MRSRLVLLAAFSTLALGSLTACGGGGGNITMKGSASAAPETTAEAPSETTADAPSETIAPGDDTTAAPGDGITGGATDLQACAELADTMSSMAMAAIGSEITPETQEKIDKVKASLPEQVQKDLDTMVKGYEALSKSGNLSDASNAVDTPEFAAASERLSDYFNNSCGAAG